MKKIKKGVEPDELTAYRTKHPDAKWEEMRHDGIDNGAAAAKACLRTCIEQQGNVCAYCECSITIQSPQYCRVEHIHPKSDSSKDANWNLDWSNMVGTCAGITAQQERKIFPHPSNMSCDAYKNYLIQKKKIGTDCENILLNPLTIPEFPPLFDINRFSGELVPHRDCNTVTIEKNHFSTTEELVKNTIDVLNLNCDRLCTERLNVLENIEKQIQKARKEGKKPQDFMPKLATYYFKTQWPQYFTTIRCRLGKYAESYLQSVDFQG